MSKTGSPVMDKAAELKKQMLQLESNPVFRQLRRNYRAHIAAAGATLDAAAAEASRYGVGVYGSAGNLVLSITYSTEDTP